ncbi:hypothetical protein [Streptomyces zagrosensis]|uniref:Uncharacterized protein n=1 Tax=Streptomyces zagrosensis TaxID=1042984 RepID=A0A7W9Q7X2_9ACTN|nr:hypothetical protein [Streptomyces zagrosensis]MBB5934192.1 hypothetical protein [Streptomyces zagrosensis]
MGPRDSARDASTGDGEGDGHGGGGGDEGGDHRVTSTESAVAVVRATAERHGRRIVVEHSIGADQSGRRSSAGAFTVADPDGSLPHEAFIEIDGSPAVEIQTFSEGDANITVDGVEFVGVPRERLPAFLDAVYGGSAWVRARTFPPSQTLIVPLPGDVTYKELIFGMWSLTPWLNRITR